MARKFQKLSVHEGKMLYEGETISDERNKPPVYDGPGYLFNNETKCFFKGTWRNGEKLCGIETFPNGDVYEGVYQGDKFHGLGLLYNNFRGVYRYEGNFEEGKRSGEGKEQYVSGGIYVGGFKNNMKHGFGKLEYKDGSYYKGDFQRGLPNGFGVHVAYSRKRIITVFPIEKDKTDQVKMPEIDRIKFEYVFEGEFVDGYKHGIGRLYEPNGSYIYAYWEYNKPVRNFVYYEADGNRHRIYNIPQMATSGDVDFYAIIDTFVKDKQNKQPDPRGGYPPNSVDGYKCLIDEKGLKRENMEDPEFEIEGCTLQVKDDTGSSVQAPIEFIRIFNLEIYQKQQFKLFTGDIRPGYIEYEEQYCDQQLSCILDCMTHHPYLLSKIISRKYEPEIGFYMIKLYIDHEWKEKLLDDKIPVIKDTKLPIFSHAPNFDLAFTLIFKAFAKLNHGQLNYFENNKDRNAQEILYTLTGMPARKIQLPNEIQDEGAYTRNQLKVWDLIFEKYQKIKIRVCYLAPQAKVPIPKNYAFQVVDGYASSQKGRDETHFVLVKSPLRKYNLKTEQTDQLLIEKMEKHSAIIKMRDRNPFIKDDDRYFFMPYKDFLVYFDQVIVLPGAKYSILNQLQLKPEEEDKYNTEARFFVKFAVNLPCSLMINITQAHLLDRVNPDQSQMQIYSGQNIPVRMVLAKEKDLFSNKAQVKKTITKNWKEKVKDIKADKQKRNIQTQESEAVQFNNDPDKNPKDIHLSLLPDLAENTTKKKAFKYIFGRGQSNDTHLFKDIQVESGIYILFVQVEVGDGKTTCKYENLRFWITLHSQFLIQIQKIPMIFGFQRIIYENAIQQADKRKNQLNKEVKFFNKGDLSEQENGSSDLVIIQYFLKKEGTYLQFLNNKSNNKIWRQKLYFRTENMMILDQRDNSKLDLQLNKRETQLVIIQQVGARPFSLEGGEGICIVDLIQDQMQNQEEEAPKAPELPKEINKFEFKIMNHKQDLSAYDDLESAIRKKVMIQGHASPDSVYSHQSALTTPLKIDRRMAYVCTVDYGNKLSLVNRLADQIDFQFQTPPKQFQSLSPPHRPNSLNNSCQRIQKSPKKQEQVILKEDSKFQDDYEQLGVVGKGYFGVVYKVLNKHDRQIYAIKQTKTGLKKNSEEAANEIQSLSYLANQGQCKYIIKYYSSWKYMGNVMIAMEYCDYNLTKRDNINEILIRKILLEISHGLKFIHQFNLVHLDIKPENILYSEQDNVFKIADFGLSRSAHVKDGEDIIEGDARYLAPEMLNYIDNNDGGLKKADIFSLGASLYELMLGVPLTKNGECWKRIRAGVRINQFGSNTKLYSNKLRQLIVQMMHPNYMMRPSAQDIINSDYFSNDEIQPLKESNSIHFEKYKVPQ